MSHMETTIISNITLQRLDDIPDNVIQEAATLFSQHYGIWSPFAEAKLGRRAGHRVQMSPNKLRDECLPAGGRNTLVRAVVDGDTIGHVCACRWDIPIASRDIEPTSWKDRICWVTQLVVRSDFRRQGIATKILRHLRAQQDDGTIAFGILSSHPAAILAFLRAFPNGHWISRFESSGEDLQFLKTTMSVSPVRYVKSAVFDELRREQTLGDALIGSADTHFYVDHMEPEVALEDLRSSGKTSPFGNLDEGFEYLAVTINP